MSEIKFSEDEIKKLNQLQTDYLEIQTKFGQLAIARLNLQRQISDLNNVESEYKDEFIVTQKSEKELVDSLTEKYGEGSFDPKTGVFTPNKKED